MRKIQHLSRLAATCAIAAAGAGAAAGPAVAAGHQQTTVLTTSRISLIHSGPNLIDTEKLEQGKRVVGEDLTYCVIGKSSANCTSAFALTGGLIYARVTETTTSGHGVLTGGTGRFARIRGTLTIAHVTRDKAKITLHSTLG